jgi:hypothetical protein
MIMAELSHVVGRSRRVAERIMMEVFPDSTYPSVVTVIAMADEDPAVQTSVSTHAAQPETGTTTTTTTTTTNTTKVVQTLFDAESVIEAWIHFSNTHRLQHSRDMATVTNSQRQTSSYHDSEDAMWFTQMTRMLAIDVSTSRPGIERVASVLGRLVCLIAHTYPSDTKGLVRALRQLGGGEAAHTDTNTRTTSANEVPLRRRMLGVVSSMPIITTDMTAALRTAAQERQGSGEVGIGDGALVQKLGTKSALGLTAHALGVQNLGRLPVLAGVLGHLAAECADAHLPLVELDIAMTNSPTAHYPENFDETQEEGEEAQEEGEMDEHSTGARTRASTRHVDRDAWLPQVSRLMFQSLRGDGVYEPHPETTTATGGTTPPAATGHRRCRSNWRALPRLNTQSPCDVANASWSTTQTVIWTYESRRPRNRKRWSRNMREGLDGIPCTFYGLGGAEPQLVRFRQEAACLGRQERRIDQEGDAVKVQTHIHNMNVRAKQHMQESWDNPTTTVTEPACRPPPWHPNATAAVQSLTTSDLDRLGQVLALGVDPRTLRGRPWAWSDQAGPTSSAGSREVVLVATSREAAHRLASVLFNAAARAIQCTTREQTPVALEWIGDTHHWVGILLERCHILRWLVTDPRASQRDKDNRGQPPPKRRRGGGSSTAPPTSVFT